jgi:hypothetical protein
MEVFPSSVMNTPAAETELNLQDIAREAANERFKTLSPSVKDESPLVQLKSANTISTTTTSTTTNSKINLLIDTLNLSIKSSMNNSISCGNNNNNNDDNGTGTLGGELKKTEENSHISGSTLSAAETLLKIKQYQPIAPPPSSHCLNDNSLASYNDENSINNNTNNNNNSCGYNSDKNDDLDFNENEDDNDDDDDENNDNSNDAELAQIKNKSPLSPPSLSASQSPIVQNDASINDDDDDDEERQILNELQNDEISENGIYMCSILKLKCTQDIMGRKLSIITRIGKNSTKNKIINFIFCYKSGSRVFG